MLAAMAGPRGESGPQLTYSTISQSGIDSCAKQMLMILQHDKMPKLLPHGRNVNEHCPKTLTWIGFTKIHMLDKTGGHCTPQSLLVGGKWGASSRERDLPAATTAHRCRPLTQQLFSGNFLSSSVQQCERAMYMGIHAALFYSQPERKPQRSIRADRLSKLALCCTVWL